jgi:glycosyltransferase involved in cell wall biosynthesis
VGSSVALIVPAFNESQLVAPFVASLTVQGLHESFTEVIFVDDGSQDSTWAQLESIANAAGNFRIVRHQVNQGLGAAIRTGVISAAADEVCWIPIDQSFEIADVISEIVRTNRSEVVLFKRALRNETARDVVSFLAHFAFRLVFGCDVRHQSGIFLMRRSLFLENVPMTKRAIANLEFIVRLHRATSSIEHVTIMCHPRISGKSKTFSSRSVLRSLRELIGLIIVDPRLLKRGASDTTH